MKLIIKKSLKLLCIFAFMIVIFNGFLKPMENKLDNVIIAISDPEKIMQIEETKDNIQNEEVVEDIQDKIEEDVLGKIMIPKINLIADIKEGTSKNIIDYYVGHFEETSLNEGNIGLAAHNRGINIKAYFSDIKNLQENDIILFQTDDIEREYKVKTIKIIEDTDFSYLQSTEDNRITLITCVNNQPDYRLCVQAVEE